ncbi:cation transporter [Lactobacillus casei] [Lactiplantibacillus mudanjiangensis]|uniref:cation diffusion facilitator family transporter n=1 Tax=Lactiplantibacillus mudanjiangensis TaxID=1296538 RepID=UPI001013DD8F|nr:cation transporter [Lactobacillus casei] [Lactiplantibacillus mudanjiangensis]
MIKLKANRRQNALQIDLAAEAASQRKNRLARRLLWLNLGFYLILSTAELTIGYWTQAAALLADGQNNLTGIFATVLLLVGLWYAQKPRDNFHLEGHWQYEALAVFLSGLLMVLIGGHCLWTAGLQTWHVLHAQSEALSLAASLTAGFSGGLLLLVAFINWRQGQHAHDSVLLAAAQDHFSDAVTSLVTMVATTLTILTHWYLLDTLTAFGLGGYIIWNGCQILSQSAAKLSNGFDPKIRQQIVVCLDLVVGVDRVIYVNGRYVGDNLLLDVAVEVAPTLTISQADQLRQQLQQLLTEKWSLLYCCIELRAA